MKKLLSLVVAIVMVMSLTVVAFAGGTAELTATASSETVHPGNQVTVTVSLSGAPVAKSMALTFTIDESAYTIVSGAWSLTGAIIANFDANNKAAAITYAAETDMNGDVFTLTLEAKADAQLGATAITVTPAIKNGTLDIACDATAVNVSIAHVGGTATCSAQAICTECGEPYGDVDPENHVHTEIKNAIPATADAEGYSGDVYCKDCGEKIADGQATPKAAYNDADGEWEFDTVLHWHTNAAGATFDFAPHVGGTATATEPAICEVCGQPYGELAAPADTTAAPADTTAAPADTTAAPADTTAAPADTAGTTPATPATGVESNIGLYVILLVVSVFGIAMVVVGKKVNAK